MSAQSEHGALADEVRLVKFPSEMFLTCFIIVGRVVLIWIMCCVALRCVALRCVVLCCVVLCHVFVLFYVSFCSIIWFLIKLLFLHISRYAVGMKLSINYKSRNYASRNKRSNPWTRLLSAYHF